jgi:EpsD family peptidyl-prolyl cis-trans isomerase
VNGVEITQREVDFIYQRSALYGADKHAIRDQRRRLLSELVRTELLAQQSSDLNLDESPDFMVAMHEARRSVRAGLTEQHLAAQAGLVSPEAVKKMVADEPEFFSQRKLLVYDQVVIPGVDEPFLKFLNVEADGGTSLDRLINEVKAKKVPFRHTTQAMTTDRIDPGIFRVLTNLSPNRPHIARIKDNFTLILMLRAALPLPLYGEAASQEAAGILNEQQRSMRFSRNMTEVLNAAKITYFGEFAPGTSGKNGSDSEVELPSGNSARVATRRVNRTESFALLVLSFASAVLVFTSSLRLLGGKNYQDAQTNPLDEPYEARSYVKFTLFGIAGLTAIATGYQLFLVWSAMPLWLMMTGIVSGLLSGIGITHLIARSPEMTCTRKVFWVNIGISALMLLVAVTATIIVFRS